MNDTFNPRTTSVPFIQEWTPKQFKAIETAILKHFRGKQVACYSGQGINHYEFKTFTGIDNIFGLAYTSSGIWACYGVCNCNPSFDCDNIYCYTYFTIGKDGRFYAVLQDKDENELAIEL